MTIHLTKLLRKVTRFEALLAGLDKAMRDLGERRRGQNSRSMNG